MFNEFTKDLKEVYFRITTYKKKELVDEFKEKWSIEGNIGAFYEKLLLEKSRKQKGSFYTPDIIYNYMNNNLIKDIIENKKNDIKILDPSCGGGFFLIDIYIKLEKILKGKEKFIIENIIYGKDLDENAVIITIIELYYLSGYISENIKCEDFLIGSKEEKYDYIIGNPPYIGHKVGDLDYKNKVSKIYSDVYYGKGDLNYCFIKNAIDILKDNGKLVFFTSRYILESLYAKGIRDYILRSSSKFTLIDFYGVRVIKSVGVDSLIMFIEKNTREENINYFKVSLNGKGKGEEVLIDIDLKYEKYSKYIQVNKESLQEEHWSFLTKLEKVIIEKIKLKSSYKLKDICLSFQGIITGKDEAFIISEDKAKELNIEKNLLKPWIKGKEIEKFKVNDTNNLIIYSDIIDKEANYKFAINHLSEYKEKLEKRRECLSGQKPWYAVQWGRKQGNFLGEKIIFPYKSNSNRFSIDRGSFFSADIYSIKLKDEYKDSYSYEFLVALLNSSLYEFYIKSMSKKLGEDLYDYYPNKIMNISIPLLISETENIISQKEIDIVLNSFFNISEEEFKVIKSWCN